MRSQAPIVGGPLHRRPDLPHTKRSSGLLTRCSARVFGKFLKRSGGRASPSTGGRLVYAVGDIHGRADLLSRLITAILADAPLQSGAPLGARPLLVFVGDYVDRGPGSRQVVDMLIALRDRGGVDVALLRGNHDDSLLRFLEEPAFGPTWLRMGGGATLAAYGVTPPAPRAPDEEWTAARDAFETALPATHLAFFEDLELTLIVGDYLFVHAGVRPGVPLEQQTPQDLMWIRGDFLDARNPSDKVVVYGHTPTADAYSDGARIGIDTGAYATGVLTAVRLHETAQNFMHSRSERGT